MLERRISVGDKKIDSEDIIITFVFVWYFCFEAFLSIFVRIGLGEIFYPLHRVMFFGIVFLYACLHCFNGFKESAICYLIIALLFIVTAAFHPDYLPWYFEQYYGIQNQFFMGTGGIWAFLVVSMAGNRARIYKNLKLICWLLFAFLSFRYISAQIRGYWLNIGKEYEELQLGYNLGFGYAMLFPVLFFAAEAFLKRKKYYYIPFALGTYMILFGGSRGSIIWIPTVFVFMVSYRWRAIELQRRVIVLLIMITTIVVCSVLYLFLKSTLQNLANEIINHSSESRTISSFLSGNFTNTNGREEIYRITIKRIQEGGLFGNGVFGERTAVGEKYRWGYAHNFFLEVYAAFGYIGGTIVCAVLIYHVVQTGRNCREKNDQIIFITFAVSSLKLLLSDSFWFNSSFWGLLAIVVLWRKQDIANGVRTKLFVIRRQAAFKYVKRQ